VRSPAGPLAAPTSGVPSFPYREVVLQAGHRRFTVALNSRSQFGHRRNGSDIERPLAGDRVS